MIEDIKESLKSVVHPSEESRFDLKTALRNLDEIVIQGRNPDGFKAASFFKQSKL